MVYAVLSELVLAVHFAFVLFVAAGALLLVRWRWLVWVHVPCAVWGVLIMFAGWICPLTPLENAFRARAGQEGFAGSFLENYLVAMVYPAGLTRGVQILLGTAALAVNLAAYLYVFRPGRRRADPATPPAPPPAR